MCERAANNKWLCAIRQTMWQKHKFRTHNTAAAAAAALALRQRDVLQQIMTQCRFLHGGAY